jgi:hypothetical protein
MANWALPKTNWVPTDGVTDNDFNRIEENTQYLKDRADTHEQDNKQHVGSLLYLYKNTGGGF